MKWLIGLSAAQMALLLMLGLRVIAIDMRTDDIADTAEAAKLAAQSLVAQSGSKTGAAAGAQTPQLIIQTPASLPAAEIDPGAENAALRQIIREELAAWSASGRTVSAGGAQQAVTHSAREAAKPYDPAQAAIAQSAFDKDFDRFKAKGTISDAEMVQLQNKIAELPPEAQRAALIKLTRAINNGEIAGNL